MIEVLKRPIESDYTSYVAYTRALEQYCNSLESQEPLNQLIALKEMLQQQVDRLIDATPPQRTWVGLTKQQRNNIENACEMIIGDPAFDAIEDQLKDNNT
jgi:hypothetical protein